MISYGRQNISQSDIDAVAAVLNSVWLTQGPVIPEFESGIARRTGAQHAIAVSSGTAALHIACTALDLGPGDFLWTTPITFIASANCARYCGAEVDFVDIDPATQNLCVSALAAKLQEAQAVGRLPKIVVAVHYAGQPCDMAEIFALSRQYGFRIIEDAAHALGATYRNSPVGNCQYSDITTFSFHPVKIITTGEGGMITTNDPILASRMAKLRSHGIAREAHEMEAVPDGPWYYQQIELGFNYRLSDIHAALGVSQLQRLDDFLAARRSLADRYDALLADLPLTLPVRATARQSAWHLYPIQMDASIRRQVFEVMRAAGIVVQVHYIPVHFHPYYRKLGFTPGAFPHAENFYARSFSIPLYPGLTQEQQDFVMTTLAQALA